MSKPIILLSGPVGSGKTTLVRLLVSHYQAKAFKSVDWLRELGPKIESSRRPLQEFGERLDKQSKGAWVEKCLTKQIRADNLGEDTLLVIDAVRIEPQIEAIRKAYGQRVVHIHLTASEKSLTERYVTRIRPDVKELASYAEVKKDKTEARVDKLADIADVVIDTDRCTEEDVLVRASCRAGLNGRDYRRIVDVMVGGGYGSEGKGQICQHLAREYDILVRVGGPNAGHSVWEDPTPYKFRLLPSGTRQNYAANLVIGPGAVIDAARMLKEISDCQVELGRLWIDPRAMVIEEADRKKEVGTVVQSIGSTGQGVGEATARKILGRHNRTRPKVRLAGSIKDLAPFIRDTGEVLELAYSENKRILLEGTQGTGLSLHHGEYPYVTSRDTTVAGCLAEAGISPSRVRRVILVCRTYPIRVESPEGGTSGPMSQEISWKVVAERSGYTEQELVEAEKTTTTNRRRRVGEFDWKLLRRSASLNAPTDIALTFVDYIARKNTKARRFEQLTRETIEFIEEVERVACAPVSLISTRFHNRSIIDRRNWAS